MLVGLLAALGGMVPAGSGRAAEPPVVLDQGWSKERRELFYYTPQGSRIIPIAWFKALEGADGTAFAAPDSLARYGLIAPDGPHPLNPDGLPIGFALDPARPTVATEIALAPESVGAGPRGRSVGLTCAACHTAEVTVNGRPIRIDGAPARFDVDRFYADLAAAVSATLFDEARFGRFAGRVLTTPGVTGAAELKLQLAGFEARLSGDAAIRRPSLVSGFGRVDALTQIVNAIAVTDQAEPANLRPVNAPTSYPPLWLTSELEFVQWNPIASSPIGRNGGEVLGVYGTATLTGDPAGWYASSLLLRELHLMETWVADLKPPPWDQNLLGRIDTARAGRGEALFRQHCAGCHNMPPWRRTDPADNVFGKTFIAIGRTNYRAVGTDPLYIESLATRLVRTNAATARLQDGKAVVPAAAYFLQTVGAILTRAMDDAGIPRDERIAMNGFRLRRGPGGAPEPYSPPGITDLKASPLAGVWATGPYLHNGSVATVYELLSPVAERRAVFWTGGRELDRERLGFVSDDAPGRFRFDTGLPGNRNIGHVYPPGGLPPEDRTAIVEYLKTQ
ncbi:di-heme-cytochrome C peroxidase [Rhodoplanes sp. TEM]|uniref:Di-heme-cytochrome C peroxidase n=1 Tax=Rhodoplanes tepidamans TaxID=200616 RepID=A0ABT5J6Q1_RHOTP|nr:MULTISPECIES: di-heme-cytochrome C peroxidase [Rhodoplanes]MDC7785325.1 di-heme-cytochrome C peroxidase [Rhodoplanes tepidamans]MDC7986264.1 di-heme-cytochrome C peroxidase [Rhodoplanes sp. TEM]MDQ0353224.1 mono/diheme cytochrome c family protein [Rhodoplanes tepidamans]